MVNVAIRGTPSSRRPATMMLESTPPLRKTATSRQPLAYFSRPCMNSAKLPDGIRLVFYAPGDRRQPPVLALGQAGTGLDLQQHGKHEREDDDVAHRMTSMRSV